ncbi:MAG: LysE family translocator [Crocinitomicaceae bacterium]|jgi:threonine/homoserine/homoserine lactone efflux protein|nr:LysE family translocator [Crocinitomicaceae bacterium]
MDIVLKAIVTGFILSIMIGPVFFVLLETSIKKGTRAAISFDLGVILSDVIYILIAYVFYSEVQALTQGSKSEWMKMIGGILFLIYGTINFFKKPTAIVVDEMGNVVKAKGEYRTLLLKGFVLNLANPLVIFYWFMVMTYAEESTDTTSTPVLFYVSIILATFFSIDLLKITAAKSLRPLMTPALLKGLNQLIGIVFVGFGLFLIINGFRSL